jgi:hypothetical protein
MFYIRLGERHENTTERILSKPQFEIGMNQLAQLLKTILLFFIYIYNWNQLFLKLN